MTGAGDTIISIRLWKLNFWFYKYMKHVVQGGNEHCLLYEFFYSHTCAAYQPKRRLNKTKERY